MAESHGPANQSGVSFQNLIAARYSCEMLSDVAVPASRHIVTIQSEARQDVDDVVITYADGHRKFVQAKEHLETTGETWRGVWSDFILQFQQASFRRDASNGAPDELCLYVGGDRQDLAWWGEALQRTRGAGSLEEWQGALNAKQRTFWSERVAPLLVDLTPADVWALLRCAWCQVRTRETLDAEALRLLPGATNRYGPVTPNNVLSHLLSRLPEDAAWRATLERAELVEWLGAHHDVRLEISPATEVLIEAVRRCSSVLRSQRHRFGEKGSQEQRHLPRPVSKRILAWLLPNEFPLDDSQSSNDGAETAPSSGFGNVAVLLDGPGRGKTVVLRDVLESLESRGITTLAIKADRQLSDLVQGRSIHQCANVGLPSPVEDVVKWLSRSQGHDRPIVVLLDQVDALSLAMTRDGYAIEAISGLVARLHGMPNVRVLLACRTYDLHTTPALRSLVIKQKFELPELSDDEVSGILADANIDGSLLSAPTRQLLHVPLHLDLFLRAIEGDENQTMAIPSVGDGRAVRSLQDIYALLWNRIIVSSASPLSAARRVACIRAIVGAMSEANQTSAPENLFLSSGDEALQEAALFLEHEGLLVKEASHWNFLHQTFFDYAFARFFVEDKKILAQTVLAGPQGLEDRPLLSHVLSYLRATSPQVYKTELEQLGIATFFDLPNLRKHLRRLLREWFGALREPSDLEWRYARRVLSDPARRVEFLNDAGRNSAWFNRIHTHFLPGWMAQFDQAAPDDQATIQLENAVFWMFRLLCDEAQHQAQILALLQPYLGRSERWNQRVQYFVFHVRYWHSSKIVALYGEVLIGHWDSGDLRHYQLRGISKQRPLDACQVLQGALELIAGRIRDAEPSPTRPSYLSNVFSDQLNTKSGGLKIDKEVMFPLAEAVPNEFLQVVWLFFQNIMESGIQDLENEEGACFPTDACQSIWKFRTSRGPLHSHHFGMALASAMGKAVQVLAKEQPEIFDAWLPQLSAVKTETSQRLVVDGFRTNPERYAPLAWEFLMADERRLELGEQAFETRRLIKEMGFFWRVEQRLALETQILNHVVFRLNEGWDAMVGREQWRLLRSLGKEYLSATGVERLDQWNEKFGDKDLPEVPILSEGGLVVSPIEDDEAQNLSDEEWLAAIAHYHGAEEHHDFLRGGAYQLSQVLERLIKVQPERFGRLFLDQVHEGVDAEYLKAAMRGLAGSVISSELLFGVVRRFLERLEPNLGEDLSITVARALGERATEGLPDDLLDLMKSWVEGSAPLSEDESFYLEERRKEHLKTQEAAP